MPPTPGELHVDRMLTNIGVAIRQSREDFVAGRVFPDVPVSKQTDKYRVYPKDWWLRTYAAQRAPATESRGIDWEYSEDAYRAEKFSIHADVPEEDFINEDDDLDVMRDATELTVEQILLKKEIDFVNTFLQTGVWGLDYDVTANSTAWTSSSTATPLNDVHDRQLRMKRLTGRTANVIASAWPTFNALRHADQILDRVIYGGNVDRPADITPNILAGLFGVDEFLLVGAISVDADQGQEGTTDADFMLPDGLLLAHRSQRPSRTQPSAGYTFTWTGAPGTQGGQRTKRFWMDELDAERVETDDYRDQKVVSSELGIFFHNTGAS